MKSIFSALALMLAAGLAVAAPPQKITAVYDVSRNGQPFATVTENYRQQDNHYKIESQTKGIGVYALFGVRKLTSEGEVTAEGLRPARFEVQQGDKKPQVATFDWESRKLTMTGKKQTVADLDPATQDLASFGYQFMFKGPDGEQISLPVTTGKKLRTYVYNVAGDNETLYLMGGLKTRRLSSVVKNEGDEEKVLWLAKDKHNLPAKIAFKDENGARIEQVLTSLTFE